MSRQITPQIDAADISERLVGITPVYLQNFLQRGTYGLRSSVSPGKVRSLRRFFSIEDVYGIALVWLLFESGLRTDPILRVLKDLCGGKKADANVAGKKLLDQKVEWIEIDRQPRGPTKNPAEMPEQVTRILTKHDSSVGSANRSTCKLLIPVGEKFRDIQHRIELLFS